MAAELYYTPGTYSSQTTGTFSFWIKRGKLNNEGSTIVWSNTYTNDNNRTYISFEANNKIRVSVQYSGNADDNVTNAQFADTLCWYHVVIRLDSTQGTAANRCLIWVNGQQQSMSSNAGSPSGNITAFQTSLSNQHYWGGIYNSTSGLDNAYLTQCVYCDGQTYSASNFGETDATTGEWKPKTDLSGLTFGNNGYWLKFENSANIGLDSSGNSNNFTNNNNEVLQVSDNPSNVFATGNPLIGVHSNGSTLVPTFSNGNNTATATGSAWRIFKSTLGASSGKYYAEFKWISDSNTRYALIGIYDEDDYANKVSGYPLANDMANGHTIYSEDGNYYAGGNSTSFGSAFSNGSIIGVAMDLDNSKIYFSKDGTWQGSANPTNGTGGKSITANKTYTFGVMIYSVGSIVYSANYGNGYFGTTAVSSAGTNASGNGIFEYDVPTGYTALSTKGLNL